MPPSPTRRRGGRGTCGLRLAAALTLVAPAAAQVLDPFQPHLRWTHAPSPAAPWLPRAVAFADDGNLVWAAAGLSAPRLVVLSGTDLGDAAGALAPLQLAALPAPGGPGGSVGFPAVCAGARPERLIAAPQVLAPDGLRRRTRALRLDPLAAARGGSFTPSWIHDPGVESAGAALLDCDAQPARVALAVDVAGSGTVQIDQLAAGDGTLLARTVLAAGAPRRLASSDDGARVALVAGARLFVLDAAGALVLDQALSTPTHALALSQDGAVVAVGDGAHVRVWTEQGGAWTLAHSLAGQPGELATRLDLDDAGTTLAVGWWHASGGSAARFGLFSGASLALVLEVSGSGGGGGAQDFPEAVALTRDGRRAAFGAWGTGDRAPELWLVDRDAAAVVLARDLPGSVQALALDPSGTRVAVALKHGHAGQASASGELRLYDSGERDLQVLGAPAPGGELHLASLAPGASTTWFLVGAPLAVPVAPPFGGGLLGVDRSRLFALCAAPTDASGRADARLRLPADPALIGVELAAQTLSRVGAVVRLSAVVVEPLIL